MKTSEQIDALAAALAKAQGALVHAQKNAVNPHLKNRYADLSSVWEACRGALSANGLAITQWPGEVVLNAATETVIDRAGNQTQRSISTISLTTRLTHSSGQWMEHVASTPLVKTDPQGIGSCLTYLRRYALAAVVGVYQDDDDAVAASGQRGQAAVGDAKTPLKPETMAELRRQLAEFGEMIDVTALIRYATENPALNALEDLTEEWQAQRMLQGIAVKRKKINKPAAAAK